jgi:hypothetical protein
MGWTFLDIEELPEFGDIVWCKYPLREKPGVPGPVARATLVRDTSIFENPETGTLYGAVEVSYGSGEFTQQQCLDDLVIRDRDAVRRCGLHKPTRFALDPRNRKNFIWCEEFFVPNDYIKDAEIVAGRLSEDEIAQMRERMIRRGLLVT